MSISIRYFAAICLLGFTVGVCHADEVDLNSGEKLIGTVTRLADGKLTFKSNVVGEVNIAVKDIRSLTTDAPITFVLAGGKTVQARLFAGAAGNFTTEAGGQETALTTLLSINPPPPPRYPLHGNVGLGFSTFNNTVSSTNFSATANAIWARPTDKITAGITYVSSKQNGEATADATNFNTEYDYGLQRRLYGFLNGGLQTDRIQSLQLRSLLGGGIGYQWVHRPRLEFGTTAGFSYLNQKFKEQDNQSKLTAQFGSTLDTHFWGNTHFQQTMSYYPNASDFGGDYYFLAQFLLERNLWGSLTGNVRYNVDYTSKPGPEAKHSTGQFIVGIGKSF